MRRHFLAFEIVAAALFLGGAVSGQPLAAPELPTPPQTANSEPGYLGLIADDRQESGRGARVKEVVEGSPAGQYGLKTGDLVTAINGQQIRSLDDFGAALQTLTANAKAAFQVERNGQQQVLQVTLGRRPPPEERRFQNFGRIPESVPNQAQAPSQDGAQTQPGMQSRSPSGLSPAPRNAPPPRPLLGIQTLPVTEETRARLRLPSTAGALVTSRTLGSPAEKAGIPLDAVIVALDGQRVGNPNDLSALLAQAGEGKTVEITYMYNGETPKSRVTLGMGNGSAMNPGPASPAGPATDSARARSATPNVLPREMMLEERVRELERRVKQLEDKLNPST